MVIHPPYEEQAKMSEDKSQQVPTGCSFLINEVGFETIQTPEKFTQEQRMFAKTASDFMEKEVFPHVEDLEHKDFDKMVEIMKKAAEVGLLLADIPEEYGGLQVDKSTSMIITEIISQYAGFAATFGAQVTIGMLPTLYFGTEEQKKHWLPKLGSGEAFAAYALTEAGSGSDALAAKTKAIESDDGEHYVVNGSKMWITNAGFADLFTVFCQVDGDKFSALLIEADREGVSVGAEEKKMGQHGSSTRQVILEDVKVPKSNVLGEVGKGHKIAFNILNIGRFKLGVGSLGGSKRALMLAAKYANEREQFGQPISSFGAIRSKLARMATQSYALESMSYRVAGYMDARLETLDAGVGDYPKQAMKAIEEFAVEDSIMKVYGSEVSHFVADQAVQIHGGYGYSAEYEVERMYRDVRISQIYEGTNEINRMLIPGMILKRTMKGQLNLFEMIQQVEAALSEPKEPTPPGREADPELSFEKFMTRQAKQLVVYTANQAIQKHMADLREQQEILLDLADMIIDLYAMDSTVTRTLQLIERDGMAASELHRAATRLQTSRAFGRIRQLAERLLSHLAAGDADKLTTHLEALEKLTFSPRVDEIGLERQIAEAVVEAEKYPF
jgi:alkylation response protein AidB-like acyl-CoA dehydrogenase